MKVIDYLQSLSIVKLRRDLDAMTEGMNRRMSQLRDYVTAVQNETTRNGESIKVIAQKLQDAIDSGDPAAASANRRTSWRRVFGTNGGSCQVSRCPR